MAPPFPNRAINRRGGIRFTACLPPSSRSCEEDGVYPDLYFGKNMLDEVPQDLYKQDWWYRTVFTAPAGFSNYIA